MSTEPTSLEQLGQLLRQAEQTEQALREEAEQLKQAADEADRVLQALSGDPDRTSIEGDQIRQQLSDFRQVAEPDAPDAGTNP